MKGKGRLAALIAAGLVLLACPGRAGAASGIVQDELTPTAAQPGTPVTATLKVHASECTTVRWLGVAVRDGLWQEGDALDFPGARENVQICPEGVTLTTAERSFRAGTYTMFGYYIDESGYHQLSNTKFTVVAAGLSKPTAGKTRVFSEEFTRPANWGRRWTRTGTSGYEFWSHNPNWDKLDWVRPRNVDVSGGLATFVARPGPRKLENGKRSWDTGLITTEGSREKFQVRPGDYVETRVKLPTAIGAFPALWTWREDDHEIDGFEHHPEVPELLEMGKHMPPPTANYHTIDPPYDKWVRIGFVAGTESVDWYIDNRLVYQDGRGVPRDWHAYLTLSLSVQGGDWHPGPLNNDPITFHADHVRVYR